MKKLLACGAALALGFFGTLALMGQTGQQAFTNHAIPIGKGGGNVGWRVGGPCAANQALVWAGATVDPTCTGVLTSSIPLTQNHIFVGNASNVATDVAMSGDATIVASGALTLATVNANVGSWGSATQTPQFTVNAKGLLTAVANVTVTPAVGSITGLGTGVATALGTNVGTAGAFVVNGGALGTPSSGTLTNATGLPIAGLANIGANTVLSNWTSGSAAVTANTWPSCASDGAHALTYTNGTGVLCTAITAGSSTGQITTQTLTSGTNATYTVTAGTLSVEFFIVGGGGGGGAGNHNPTSGTAGGSTCLKASGTACTTPLVSATGGGASSNIAAGAAGIGTNGTANCNRIAKGMLGAVSYTDIVGANVPGGNGGPSWVGGGEGGGIYNAAGGNADANSGGGGGGGGAANAAVAPGFGGSAGGLCHYIINSPAATYVYTIGAGGNGDTSPGANGFSGGNGGSGVIYVVEHH